MDPPSCARPVGRLPGQRTGSTPSPVLPPQRAAAKVPTTFAEMGIQGVELEEKECAFLSLFFLVNVLVLICYNGLIFKFRLREWRQTLVSFLPCHSFL